MTQFRIEPPSGDHDRSHFSSGSGPLDKYFREQVSQDIRRRITSCYVAVPVELEPTQTENARTEGVQRTRAVAGFYTLTAAGIALNELPPEIVKKLPRYPVVPAALMGRLAVDESYQGQGLGGILLANALLRIARAELGFFAMLVDAKDDAAKRFYERYGFTLLPGEGRRLCFPIALALRQIEGHPERPA